MITTFKFKFIFFSQTESNYDFVTIYDGSDEKSTQIKKLSGWRRGISDISSTSNSLFVKFESDGTIRKQGFFAIIEPDTVVVQLC